MNSGLMDSASKAMWGMSMAGMGIADVALKEGEGEAYGPYFLSCPLPRKHNYHGSFSMLHMS